MDAQLAARIDELRRALDRAGAEAKEIGYLAPPSARATFPQEVPASYQAFLRLADGAVCGQVHLYESAQLLQQQAPAKNLRGGRPRWFCIGEACDQTLVMDVMANTVHLVDPSDPRSPGESLGEFDYFLVEDVFGDGYADLVPEAVDDPWLQFLHSIPAGGA